MMAGFKSAGLLPALLFLTSCTTADAQSVMLRLRLPKGGGLIYFNQTSMSMKISGKVGEPPATLATKQLLTLRLAIAGTAAGNYKVVNTVTSSKTTVPQGSAFSGSLEDIDKSTVGSSTESVYDDRGNTVGVAKVRGKRAEQMGQLAGSFGYFNTGFMGVLYPKGPVKVGSTWMTTVDIGRLMAKAMGGMSVANKEERVPVRYTLKKLERKGAKRLAHIAVAMKGRVSLAPTAQGGQITGSGVEATIRSSGTIVVDLRTGIPQSCTVSAQTELVAEGKPYSHKVEVVSRLK